jgi:hypothetical protein
MDIVQPFLIARMSIAGTGATLKLSVVSGLPSIRFGVGAPDAAVKLIPVPVED